MAEEVSFAEKVDKILEEVGGKITPVIFTFPLTPQKLNEQLRSAADIYGGALLVGNYRYSSAVPEGYVLTATLSIPDDWTDTSTIIKLTSDYYDPDILVEVYSDRRKIHPERLPFTGVVELDFGSYYTKRAEIMIRISNYTTTDIVFSYAGKLCLMRDEIYHSLYEPTIGLTNEVFGRLTARKIPIPFLE